MTDKYYVTHHIYSEKEKDGEEYLVNCIDKAIAELVHEKEHLVMAYNYYNGTRDAEQFRFLEENYGIGNPTAVEFIPLIRRHVDALIGEHLQNKLNLVRGNRVGGTSTKTSTVCAPLCTQ